MDHSPFAPRPSPTRPAELLCVDPARMHEIWPHVVPLIAQAMRRGGMGAFADVERSLGQGRALLCSSRSERKRVAAPPYDLCDLGIKPDFAPEGRR
jgi:hypothetical protein